MKNVNFEVETEVVKKNAEQMIALIKGLQKDFNSVEQSIMHSEHFWSGEASGIHQASFSKIQEELSKSLNDMEKKAEVLFDMMGIYEKSEVEIQSQIINSAVPVLRIR